MNNIKNIIIAAVLAFGLLGCSKSMSENKRESNLVRKRAEVFCSCRKGIKELQVWEYEEIKNSGVVTCNDLSWIGNLDTLEVACGVVVYE